MHVLPHRGGGAEHYIDLLERLPGYEHERLALSRTRAPVGALPSIIGRRSAIERQARGADLVHVHGDVAAALSAGLLARHTGILTSHGLHMLRRLPAPAHPFFAHRLERA